MSTEPGSVSCWLQALGQGCTSAASPLWNRYYDRLLGIVRQRLHRDVRRVADEEDIVSAALASILSRGAAGQFPELNDREAFWRLLVHITFCKLRNQHRDLFRQKRGGGRTLGESAMGRLGSHPTGLQQLEGPAPDPAELAEFSERLERFLGGLDEELRCIALCKLSGFSNAEIASTVGRSLPTIERRLRLLRDKWQQPEVA